MKTLEKVRKAPHNRCFGIEIECVVPNRVQPYSYMGFWFVGTDGSIDSGWRNQGIEFVSQPLPYKALIKQINILHKKVGGWASNESCGIHVHVSKSGVSLKRIERLAKGIEILTQEQFNILFGRYPNTYCHKIFSHSIRHAAINFTNNNTIEFRMFSSGNAVWAKECLRRTKLMCEYRGKVTYENLLELFTKPEGEMK